MSSGQKRKNSAGSIPIKSELLFNQLLVIVIAISVTVIPIIFDSFTASKLLVASFGLLIFSVNFLRLRSAARINVIPPIIVILVTSYFLALVIAWWKSDVPFLRGAFGQFGRGNGLFYYFFSILILIFSIKTITFADKIKANKLVTYFSWFLALYASLQRLGIDIAQLDTRGISPVVLTYGNSNFAGGMLAVLFTYHLIYAVTAKKFPIKTISLLVLLLVSSTFAAAVQGYLIIMFAIGLAISLFIYQKYKSDWVLKTILASWTLVVLSIVLGLKGTFVLSRIFDRPSFQARIEYWQIAIKVISDYPLFGVGPDKLYDVSSNYMSPGSLKLITNTRMDNAHNWYLNLAANFGLPALVFLLLIFCAVFLTGFSLMRKRNELNPFAVASFTAFCAVFIDGLVSLEQPGLGIWLYFFAGVTIGNRVNTHRSIDQKIGIQGFKGSLSQEKIQRTLLFIPVTALIFSTVATSGRVIQDALLRHAIQAQLSVGVTDANLASIASAAVNLKAEPEYAVQSLKYLALAGDGGKIEKVSKATYEYDMTSIQAALIRADVLRALGRNKEACSFEHKLLENTPWDHDILHQYLVCAVSGLTDNNHYAVLNKARNYLPPLEDRVFENNDELALNLNKKFAAYATSARVNFYLGKIANANSERLIAIDALQRLQTAEKLQSNTALDPLREEYALFIKF